MFGAFVAGSQPWEYVFTGWSVFLAAWDHAPAGEAFVDASSASQRSRCYGFGAGYRACGESGVSDLGLPWAAASLSWADLSVLFLTVDPGVLFGNGHSWVCGKMPDPAAVSQFPFVALSRKWIIDNG